MTVDVSGRYLSKFEYAPSVVSLFENVCIQRTSRCINHVGIIKFVRYLRFSRIAWLLFICGISCPYEDDGYVRFFCSVAFISAPQWHPVLYMNLLFYELNCVNKVASLLV